MGKTCILVHLILSFQALEAEEIFQWLLLFAVDIRELVFSARLQADRDIEGATGTNSPTDSAHGDDGDVVESDECRRLGYEQERALKTEEVAFVRFDGALDTRLRVVRVEVLGRLRYLLARETLEDFGDHGRDRRFVARLQFACVFGLEIFFCHVQVDGDFFFALELHDQERVARLTLAERRVQADGDERV